MQLLVLRPARGRVSTSPLRFGTQAVAVEHARHLWWWAVWDEFRNWASRSDGLAPVSHYGPLSDTMRQFMAAAVPCIGRPDERTDGNGTRIRFADSERDASE